MLELLLKKMDAYQAKMEANHKELLSRLEADRQAKRRELKETMKMMAARLEKTDTSHMEMVPENRPERDMETMAC
jgi:hypothetical protein